MRRRSRFGAALYDLDAATTLPETARLASLGCGNPTAVAELGEGETVLDLGSGGGIDVLLSARRVGPTGTAYGLDMTDEMLALAQRNAAEAGVTNVALPQGPHRVDPAPCRERRRRHLELRDQPLAGQAGRARRDRAGAQARRPCGHQRRRRGGPLTPSERAERGSWAGCVAGALSREEYVAGLEAAGLTDVEVRFTHGVADGMHAAIVKARSRRGSASQPLTKSSYGGSRGWSSRRLSFCRKKPPASRIAPTARNENALVTELSVLRS